MSSGIFPSWGSMHVGDRGRMIMGGFQIIVAAILSIVFICVEEFRVRFLYKGVRMHVIAWFVPSGEFPICSTWGGVAFDWRSNHLWPGLI